MAKLFEKYFPNSASDSSDNAAPSSRPRLLCLVKENLDSELRSFLPFIAPGGELFLHKDCALFKMLQKPKLKFWDLFSWSTLKKYRADTRSVGGNMKGEGLVKGAVLVLGSRDQGILHTHFEDLGHEMDFGAIESAMQQMTGAKVLSAEEKIAEDAKPADEPAQCSSAPTRAKKGDAKL